MSEFICSSCMWQGDLDDVSPGGECPKCQDACMDREQYDRQKAENNRDEELEERRNGN